MPSLRLLTTFAVIYGSFTLGFYVAIQGPTLIDLIDLLHVNQDIMSYSLAFASLAYSVGGLLSGFLFNYVDRQMLIIVFFFIFGISNVLTPFLTNYTVYTVITVFKMMCAGGTDCGANVWILEMWPGKDSWLQALHFTFAVGCALGPLLVEPFLSVEEQSSQGKETDLAGKASGNVTIPDQAASESRIYIPFGVSGLASVLAAFFILILYFHDPRRRQLARDRRLSQAVRNANLVKPLLIPLKQVAGVGVGKDAGAVAAVAANSVAVVSGLAHRHGSIDLTPGRKMSAAVAPAPSPPPAASDLPAHTIQALVHQRPTLRAGLEKAAGAGLDLGAAEYGAGAEADAHADYRVVPLVDAKDDPLAATNAAIAVASAAIAAAGAGAEKPQANAPTASNQSAAASVQIAPQVAVKITSKAREQYAGRPPYYVMFAIALAAMCLSFYCGIEITSMNYLATFAVNIDLGLRKSTAALMSSALTISFAVGRGFGIWIAAHVKPHKLFYLCASLMAAGNVLMLIFANSHEELLWCSICLFGIGCGPMFPAIVSFFDDKISKVTNSVSGIFISGSMFNVALNSLIIGHRIIDNALILIICNLVGSVTLMLLFGSLHMLTRVKKSQRVRKFRLRQQSIAATLALPSIPENPPEEQEPPADAKPGEAAPADAVTAAIEKHELAAEPPSRPPKQPPQQQQQQLNTGQTIAQQQQQQQNRETPLKKAPSQDALDSRQDSNSINNNQR